MTTENIKIEFFNVEERIVVLNYKIIDLNFNSLEYTESITKLNQFNNRLNFLKRKLELNYTNKIIKEKLNKLNLINYDI